MRAVLRLSVMVLLTALVLFAAYTAGFGLNYYQVRTQATSLQIPSNFGLFWESFKIIQSEFYGDVPNPRALTHGAINGMLQGLGDPHTVLVEPEPAQNEQTNLQGNTGDVGLNIDLRNGLITIVSPIPGSPADKAGLRAGDIILKIGEKDLTVQPMSVQEATAQLRGPVGSTLSLTIHRIGEDTPITAEMTRAVYNLPTVNAKMLPGTTLAYFKVTLETAATANEFAQALDTIKAQRPTGIVLDLRNNPGGLFPDPVLDIAGQFLKNSDVVVIEKYRDGHEKTYPAGSRRGATDLPLVVLVNNGTASAAEILAGALKDYKRGVLIGEPTYGKGSVQEIKPLSDGSALHITIATWYTPNHTQIEGTGLQPDLAVPLTDDDIRNGVDPQLNRAIDYLKKGA
ncbi:MAG: S41 family peptidase [Chloroflexota bacterium]|nr:S41 family peptidase [Chloroflexota bacterium]